MPDLHPLARAFLEADAATHGPAVQHHHPLGTANPGMARAKAHMAWVAAGCPIDVPSFADVIHTVENQMRSRPNPVQTVADLNTHPLLPLPETREKP